MNQNLIVSTGGHYIDPFFTQKKGSISIIEKNGSIYDCVLNQTNIGVNSNKFYIMQALECGTNDYVLFIRYGRIGDNGVSINKIFKNINSVITEFEKVFRTKTGNNWYNTDNFEQKAGKYYLSKIEAIAVSESDSGSESSSDSQSSSDMKRSKYLSGDHPSKKVIQLLSLISNTTYMTNTLVQLDIDTEKMPLGKISQGQIDSGYEILNKINKIILANKKTSSVKNKLIELSSSFYTVIPISCGRKIPPIISTIKLVGKNINLLNELSQMVYGTKAVTKFKKDKKDFIKLYKNLCTEIVALEKTDEMYSLLENYVKQSKAPTHKFNYKIIDMFEIARDNERDLYDKFNKKIDNRVLLFHGTRVCNMIGILQNGLVCDLSKLGIVSVITGKMFGLGVYFANSVTKSIQYTAHDSSDNIACIFVAEVALGNQLVKKSADHKLTVKNMPKGYNSTWGIGQSTISQYDEYNDGTSMPSGSIVKSPHNDASLLYDEFIVYNDEQINLRYIIRLQINDDKY